LPEALWKMLHPAKTAKRWFLRLEGMSAERQAERAQSARRREAQQRERAAESAAREARRDEQLAAEQVKAQAASRSKLVYGIGLAALVAAVVAALLLYR
jgi:ferric-dicitrate binding protein FerR (iron transport regulator)